MVCLVFRILEEKDYENGIRLLLSSIGDISLDTPEAATVIIENKSTLYLLVSFDYLAYL